MKNLLFSTFRMLSWTHDHLLDAAERGDIETMQRALAAPGICINDRHPENGETALIRAAKTGQVEALRILHQRGAACHIPCNCGLSPLLHAAKNGHKSAVEALLELGADINAASPDGKTALSLALACGHDDLAKHLAECGAQECPCHRKPSSPLPPEEPTNPRMADAIRRGPVPTP